MTKRENGLSDFELLTLLVQRLKNFSYKEVQDNARKIQKQYRLFQVYFNNCGDIEGAGTPESLQLSFHFKVLNELGYIQRVGTEYMTSEKCKEEANRIKHSLSTSKVAGEMLTLIFSK